MDSKIQKKTIAKRFDQIKIIAISFILLLIIVTLIITTIKKEEQDNSADTKIATEFDQNGEFLFSTTDITKTIIFKVKNESSEMKSYNLGIQSVTNLLKDRTTLTYDLWINENQEVFHEIFPNNDMLLLDGAKIDAHKDLDFKLVLNYKKKTVDENQTIRGKLVVEDTKH